MGTWLGVTKNGRFAALTNWTEKSSSGGEFQSRGNLVSGFLIGNDSAQDYAHRIRPEQYQGFNLVLFDGDALVYTSNRLPEIQELNPGIHALTNTQLGDAWPRAIDGAKKLVLIATEGSTDELIDALFDTGIDEFKPSPEEHNAPCFILGEQYGTRSTTAVVISKTDIRFTEQTYGPMGCPELKICSQFEIIDSGINQGNGSYR